MGVSRSSWFDCLSCAITDERHGAGSGIKMSFDKRTRRFMSGLDTAKSQAAANGIELTPDEAAKAAMKRALGAKKGKARKKKKGRGGSPFFPGSFESSSR